MKPTDPIHLGLIPQDGLYARFFPKRVLMPVDSTGNHVHVLGITGSGKSRWLCQYYLDLVKRGIGVTLIDPAGDLSRLILGLVAQQVPDAVPDLTYLDFRRAADRSRYLPFNVLKQPGNRSVVAQNVLQAFHRAWPSDIPTTRIDRFVLNGSKALAGGNVPLPFLFRFLNNVSFRAGILNRERDADLVEFWRDWYDRLPEMERQKQIESTNARISLLTFDEVLRHSLGAEELAINFREMMDNGKHMLVNLAGLTDETQRLLGSLFTVMMEQAALSREDSRQRRTHVLIIDEFAKFAAKSEEALQTILSQTRKYGLFLVMAHQNWTQASERMRGAMGNARLKIAFQLDYPDAVRTAPEFVLLDPRTVHRRSGAEGESVSADDQIKAMVQQLQRMPPRHALVRLPDDSIHTMVTSDVPDPQIDTTLLERDQLERNFREVTPAMLPDPTPIEKTRLLKDS
jgi:hypothetical protein